MYNIVIDKNSNITTIAVIEDDQLVELYKEKNDWKRLEGNIYIGKVKNIINGMQSAFIDIGEGKNALVHIKDLIPKASNITGNVYEDVSKMEISKIVKPGEKVLVQVKRDCNEEKGARVTKDIKINGNFSILMPFSKFITVSQKINDEKEKERLKSIVKEVLPNEYGVIIRTAANRKSKYEIQADINKLLSVWRNISEKAENEAPTKVFDNGGIIGKIITDLAENDLERIYTNNTEILKEFSNIQDKIQLVQNSLEMFDIQRSIEQKRKIWLKCGGFITIDKAEALTAIDVNSGKFTGKNELEKTVLKVNLEASKEIAKQIRLRDIGGIIVIDYIDMEDEKDRRVVKETMMEFLKKDRSKVQVMEFTKLGLLEITRKHILGR